MERYLEVLGVRLRVETDAPDLVAPFFAVFGAFESRPRARPGEAPDTVVRIESTRGRVEVGGGVVHLAGGTLAGVQTYNLLYRTLARAVSEAYLLHAAAVSAREQAFVIAGPAGSGKTSLARVLATTGFSLMSDDIAPLSLDGSVHPFPRRVGVVDPHDSGGGHGVAVGSKVFVAAEDLGAAVERRSLPLGAIVLMNPYAVDSAAVPVRIGVLGDGSTIVAAIRNVPGIDIVGIERAGSMAVVDVRTTGGVACAAVDRAIDAADVDLVFHSRGYGDVKRYVRTPALDRVPSHEAGVELLREALNREPRGALLARHGGSVVAALVELTGLVARAPCYRLVPGTIEDTAAILREAFLAERPG